MRFGLNDLAELPRPRTSTPTSPRRSRRGRSPPPTRPRPPSIRIESETRTTPTSRSRRTDPWRSFGFRRSSPRAASPRGARPRSGSARGASASTDGWRASATAPIRPSDSIKVDDRRVRPETGPRTYILLNKPKGFVTTVSDPEGRDTVLQLLPGRLRRGVKPVGRLDVQTEGLLLLTDDGDLARTVTHPSTGCPKEYSVKVAGEPSPRRPRASCAGASSSKACARVPATSSACRERRGAARRRGTRGCGSRCAKAGRGRSAGCSPPWATRCSKLKRVAIGPIRDDDLPAGAYRNLSAPEVAALKRLGKAR